MVCGVVSVVGINFDGYGLLLVVFLLCGGGFCLLAVGCGF